MKQTKTLWMVKQTAGTLDIYLYDNIVPDGEDWWTGEKIPSETSANHVQQVLESAGMVNAINVYINSYGGDVKEGIAIYNLLLRSQAYKTAYIDGFACSVASVIPMACDKIVMGANTLMMVHNASMGAWGTSAELRKAADDLDVINSAAVKSYLLKAGEKLDEATLQPLLDNETWLTAEQCVQYGLADEIAQKANPATTAATQRLEQARAAAMEAVKMLHNPSSRVPEQYNNQKTNAERLMAAFRKKMEA
jgi:ATP-dependent Clp protease protease subunit